MLLASTLLILFGFVTGAVLVYRGLRGTRVGNQPVCRRCQYDLRGLPAEARVCPECGAALTDPRAIVVGRRSRRRMAVVAGMVLWLLSGLFAYHVAHQLDVQRIKPVWLLKREGRNSATHFA